MDAIPSTSNMELDKIHSLCYEKADEYAHSMVDELYSARVQSPHHPTRLNSVYIGAFIVSMLVNGGMIISWEQGNTTNFYLLSLLLAVIIFTICAIGIYHNKTFKEVPVYSLDDDFSPSLFGEKDIQVLQERLTLPGAHRETIDDSYNALIFDITHHEDREHAQTLARHYIVELVQESMRLNATGND